jgi:hypothetical protein
VITLDEFEVYRYYLALRLHFTTDYDVVKMKGRLKANRAAFAKRKDMQIICKKLASKLDERDIVNFFVANFVAGVLYGGTFNTCSDKVFKEWTRRIESLTYIFSENLSKLRDSCEKQHKEISYIFECNEGQHPLLLRSYLCGDISIETLIILNDFHSYIDNFDKQMYNDIVWNGVSRLIKKYRPFLQYDKKKISDVYSSRFE